MNIKNKIVIIDYGSGNIQSVSNALNFLKKEHIVSNKTDDIYNATHLILPGVGSYSSCMRNIKKNIDLKNFNNQIIDKKKYLLGICVGMQILSSSGNENNFTSGLDFIKGSVIKINHKNLPKIHIGWNEINIKKKSKLLTGIKDKSNFYFVHSYHFTVNDKDMLISETTYSDNFASIIEKNNIFGVQFHPEKSQINGLKLLKNFIEM